MKRDLEKTAAANLTDTRSYIRPDGRAILFGQDMMQLRRRVYERSVDHRDYRCECFGECGTHKGRCPMRINWFTMELSHKIARSKGRDDSEANCIASCHACHVAYEDWHPKWSKGEKE